MKNTNDLHVLDTTPLITPAQLKHEAPITEAAVNTVVEGRLAIKRMMRGKDDRFLVIVGPCSIHDERIAYDYAERLKRLSEELSGRIFMVMRVYFEKPRTTIGWKGLISDPNLDGSGNISDGIRKAREIMHRINDMGIAVASEVLDPIVPQYLADLLTWAAIGARTTESQTHREMTSGLSMPVGFKNGTEGNLQIAIDGMQSARAPHNFLGVNQDGQVSIVKTSGNVWSHVILRGGRLGPNYDRESVHHAVQSLKSARLTPHIMIDCSHANSDKDHAKQERVLNSAVKQRLEGNRNIIGVMLESNLNDGKQSIPEDLSQLKYGVSITDACIGWETTERILREAHEQLGNAEREI